MWMMGYNDEGDIYMADSFNGRRFRPLIPRPISSAAPNCGGNGPGVTLPPCFGHLHRGADVFSLNPNHIGTMSEQSKRELNPQHQVVVSSRWNPTPEQLSTLEELYSSGTRTPSAEQIQHITAQLRRYGKIEGKNVFYWFQNHKARERQKRRRQMESDGHLNINGGGHCGIEILGRKETGAEGECNKIVLGVDHHLHRHHHHQANKDANNSNIWPHPMNCSTIAEEPATSMVQKTMKPRGGGMERKSAQFEHHQWLKIDENGDWQTRRNVNETWEIPTQLINTPTMDPKFIINNKTLSDHHLTGFFIAHPPPPPPTPYTIRTHEEAFINSHILNICDEDEEEEDDNYDSSQTLQLFPLRSGDSYANEKETETSVSVINGSIAHPYQFFEFLPLKN